MNILVDYIYLLLMTLLTLGVLIAALKMGIRDNIKGLNIKEIVVIGIIAISTYIATAAELKLLAQKLPELTEYRSYIYSINHRSSLFIVNFIIKVLYMPIIEEIIFRFGSIKLLDRMINDDVPYKNWLLIMESGAIFSLAHVNMIQSAYAIMCGIILGYLYLFKGFLSPREDRNLARPLVFHAIFNLTGLLLA